MDRGSVVGKLGLYLSGDTPGSSKFVTGRLVLGPGKTLHPPHTHLEEEVMADLAQLLNKVSKDNRGVSVQASTLGSLEALLEF